jgi:hypothetical protein
MPIKALYRYARLLTGICLLVLCVQATTLAQKVDCPNIVRNALKVADQFCENTRRNEACYGNIVLEAESQPGIQELRFKQPGDRVSVNTIKSLTLSPMDAANQIWGIALMRIQANLPDTLPGQNVTFLLFGNVEIENAVDTNTQPPTVRITTPRAVNIRKSSSKDALVIGSTKAGDVLIADGRSRDGAWLRVQSNKGIGWIAAGLVQTNDNLQKLAVIDAAPLALNPMQAFYFRTGVADAPCAEAPDSGILIQTPQGAGRVDLRVNEVDITLGSTVYLEAQPNGNMTIDVLEGQATVSAQGTTVVAPAGTRVIVPLDANLRASGIPSPSQPYNPGRLSVLPVSVLPDTITIAPPLVATTGATPSATPPGGAPQAGLPVSGNWCPTATGCTSTVLPTPIQFTYENNGSVLILAYEGGAERYTQTEPGVYTWSQGGTKAVLRVLSSSHFIQEFTFAGGNTSKADWTLRETTSTPAPG